MDLINIPTFTSNLQVHFNRSSRSIWIYNPKTNSFLYGNPCAISIFGHETLSQFITHSMKDTSPTTQQYAHTLLANQLHTGKSIVKPWTFYPNTGNGLPIQARVQMSGIVMESGDFVLLNEVVGIDDKKEGGMGNTLLLGHEAFRFAHSMISIFQVDGSLTMSNLKGCIFYTEMRTFLEKHEPSQFIKTELSSLFVDPSFFATTFTKLSSGENVQIKHVLVFSGKLKNPHVLHDLSMALRKNPISGKYMIVVEQRESRGMHASVDKRTHSERANTRNVKLLQGKF